MSELRYRGDDWMLGCRYGNGQLDQRSYDLQGRLTAQRLSGAEDTQTDARSYRYDANSNILDLSGSYERNRYGYDALDWLQSDGIDEASPEQYEYDLNHNRLSAEQEGAGNIRYDYAPGSNRLEASEERRGAGAAPFAPRTSRRLEYNDAGRLWRLHEGDPPDQRLRTEYIYNGMGQRTRKVVHDADGSNRKHPACWWDCTNDDEDSCSVEN